MEIINKPSKGTHHLYRLQEGATFILPGRDKEVFMRCNTGPTLNNKYAHILVVNLVSGTVDQMPANDLVCPVVYGLMEM